MAAVYAATHRNGAAPRSRCSTPTCRATRRSASASLREGYAANRVEHPGAVKVLDDDVVAAGPESGAAYIVMELLEGESLQDRLERGPQLGERRVSFDSRIRACSRCSRRRTRAAWSTAISSRRTCSSCVRRDEAAAATRARVKVLDFGLARHRRRQAITSYGLALGTPSFMSPEQAAGRIDEIDGRTDLFALAATGFRSAPGGASTRRATPSELVRKMATPRCAPRAHGPARGQRAVRARHRPCARVPARGSIRERAAMREDVERAIAEIEVRPRPAIVAPELPPPKPRPTKARPTAPAEPHDPNRHGGPLSAAGCRATCCTSGVRAGQFIRIPKTGSILPWFALLLVGSAGVALWRDDALRTRVIDHCKAGARRSWDRLDRAMPRQSRRLRRLRRHKLRATRARAGSGREYDAPRGNAVGLDASPRAEAPREQRSEVAPASR